MNTRFGVSLFYWWWVDCCLITFRYVFWSIFIDRARLEMTFDEYWPHASFWFLIRWSLFNWHYQRLEMMVARKMLHTVNWKKAGCDDTMAIKLNIIVCTFVMHFILFLDFSIMHRHSCSQTTRHTGYCSIDLERPNIVLQTSKVFWFVCCRGKNHRRKHDAQGNTPDPEPINCS